MPTATKATAKKTTANTKKATPTLHTESVTTHSAAAASKNTTAKATGTVAKPAPPVKVTEYVATLSTDEQRYGRKAWRHATGQRGTAPSLRGVAPERAKAIREQIAALAQ